MISLIVAMNRDGLIGLDGGLPWSHRPEDMKNFLRITRGNIIVMGRKTYESISKPLLDRENFVITSDPMSIKQTDGLTALTDPKYFIEGYNLVKREYSEDIGIFIIGGMQIFKSFAPFVERMYITVIHEYNPIFNGREAVYFPWPSFAGSSWQCTEQRPLGRDFYYIYERSTSGNKKTQEYG